MKSTNQRRYKKMEYIQVYQYCSGEKRWGNNVQKLKELMKKMDNSGKHFLDSMLVISVTLLTIVKFIYFKFKKPIGTKIQHRSYKATIIQDQYEYKPLIVKFHQHIGFFLSWKISIYLWLEICTNFSANIWVVGQRHSE